MTKNAAVNFGYYCHCFHYFSAIINLSKTVAVIAKVDCRVFCHINWLGDKISNTAAPIQPNPFWFWEKYIYSDSQNQKGFGCIDAAVLLIFSSKDLI